MCAWDVCLDGVQLVGWQQTEASCSESDGRNFRSYRVVVNPEVCVRMCVCEYVCVCECVCVRRKGGSVTAQV